MMFTVERRKDAHSTKGPLVAALSMSVLVT